MKTLKKALSIVLCLALMLSCVAGMQISASAEGEGEETTSDIVISTNTECNFAELDGQEGYFADLDVFLDEATSFASLGLKVEYNSSVVALSYVSDDHQNLNANFSYQTSENNSANPYTIVWYSHENLAVEAGKIAFLNFKYKGEGEIPEDFTTTVTVTPFDPFDQDGNELSLNAESFTVNFLAPVAEEETECEHSYDAADNVNFVEFTAEGIVHYENCTICGEKVVTSSDTSADAVTVAGKALNQSYVSAINVTAGDTYTFDVTETTNLMYAYVNGDDIIANAATNFHTSLNDGDLTNGENPFAATVSGDTVTLTTDFAGIFIAFVPKDTTRLQTNGTIGMNTYFSLESSIAMDLAINTKNITTAFDDYYAIVNHQKYSGTEALPVEDVRIDEYTVNGTYYRFNYSVAAKEINDEISYRWYGVVDGVDYLLRERVNYTLVNYAANQYSNANADAGLKTLLSTLFKYGATAQQYFNYHNTEETLVTSNPLIASHYETYPPADVIALEDIDKMETTGSTHLDPNNKLFGYGRGLNCESTVEIYFGVKCLDFFNANPDADISKFTFVVSYLESANETAGTFTTETLTYEDAYKVTESEKRYFFRVDKIAAAMMNSEAKIDVYYDGEWQSGCNYTINNYLYTNYSKTNTNTGGTANLGDICKAIATYGDAARDYFKG